MYLEPDYNLYAHVNIVCDPVPMADTALPDPTRQMWFLADTQQIWTIWNLSILWPF